jgi:hypothetical protein
MTRFQQQGLSGTSGSGRFLPIGGDPASGRSRRISANVAAFVNSGKGLLI